MDRGKDALSCWNTNGWLTRGGDVGGQDGSTQGPNSTGCETDQLRSGLLAEIGPRCNVQHRGIRPFGGVRRGFHEDLSCTMNGSREVGGGVSGVRGKEGNWTNAHEL